MPSNVKVPLVMTAADDFGVKDAMLSVQPGERDPLLGQPAREAEADPAVQGDVHDRPGREEGQARHEGRVLADRPRHQGADPNRVETPRQIIKVAEPVRGAEKKAIETAFDKEKQEAEKKLPAEPAETETPEPPMPGEDKTAPDSSNQGKDGQAAKPTEAGGKDTAEVEPTASKDEPPPTTPEDQAQIDRVQKAIQKANRNAGTQQPRGPSQPGAQGGSQTGAAPQGTDNTNAPNRPNAPSEPAVPGNRGVRPDANAPPSTGPGTGTKPGPGEPGSSQGSDQVSRAEQTPTAAPPSSPAGSPPQSNRNDKAQPSSATTPGAFKPLGRAAERTLRVE